MSDNLYCGKYCRSAKASNIHPPISQELTQDDSPKLLQLNNSYSVRHICRGKLFYYLQN